MVRIFFYFFVGPRVAPRVLEISVRGGQKFENNTEENIFLGKSWCRC